MLEILTPYMLPALAVLGGVAVGHFGTARIKGWAASAKAEASKVGAAVSAGEHASAEAAADTAVKAVQWLTNKSRQQRVIDAAQQVIVGAQAEMGRMDALAAHVVAQIQKPQ